MLVNGQTVLEPANTHSFAVPAFNISNWAMFNGVMETSEALEAPVIIAIHPDELAHTDVDLVAAIIARAHRSTVPVAIHLDHGATFEQVMVAIQSGFTSVMLDASLDPFDQNVAICAKVVEAAHAVDVSVEGELGTIGALDGGVEGGAKSIIYTDPADAARFVAESGVDSLAVAIGTHHGIYPKDMEPHLELGLLRDIKKAVPLPLVLHGGSDNPDDEIGAAAHAGINKINISSDIKVAFFTQLREVLTDQAIREPNVIEPPAVEAMNRVVAHKIRLFGADGKAHLYR